MNYSQIGEIIGVVILGLILFRLVNKIFGIAIVIIGILFIVFQGWKLFSSSDTEKYVMPNNIQLLYNSYINTPSKIKLEYDNFIRAPVPKKIYRINCTADLTVECGGRLPDINVIANTKQVLYDWDQIIYTDKDVEMFFENEFGSDHIITKAYNLINPKYGAARADFVRYLLIYKYGGLYLDMKSCVTKYLPEMPDNVDMWVSRWNRITPQSHIFPNTGEYQNWYIYARKGAPILKDIIEQVVNNIYTLYENPTRKMNLCMDSSYAKCLVLSITGPIAMTISILNSKNNKSVCYDEYINNHLTYSCAKNIIVNTNHYSKQKETLIKQYSNTNYIPKVVYMTYHDLSLIPSYVRDNINKYCSGYDIQIYDDDMCIDFLRKYYGENAVSIFKNMDHGAHSADFWRYCILYTFGGHYFDIKTDFQTHISNVFNTTIPNTWYIVRGASKDSIYNGIIATPSHNPILLKAIKNMYKKHNTISYLYNTRKLFKILTNSFKNELVIGNNKQLNGWDCIVLNEQCNYCDVAKKKCDIYNFDCMIYDVNGNKIFNTRYKDFPWKSNVFISMTTLPERLSNEWFLNNLKKTLSLLSENQTVILNVPEKSLKWNPYTIPVSVSNLQGKKFIINRCEVDEGPITKLLPTLRNNLVKDTDIIIVCDDDISYKENTFKLLENGVLKNSKKITTICKKSIEGFKGFAFYKKVLKGLLNIEIPKSCIRIDDDVISWFVTKFGIKVNTVYYNNSGARFCSINRDETGTHPKWAELINDNRKPMVKQCLLDLDRTCKFLTKIN